MSRDFTFVVTAFERPKAVRRCIESVSKVYPNAKVIIADNSQYPLTYYPENVTVVDCPYNIGASRARNIAISHVETEYFVLLEDDMIVTFDTNIELMTGLMADYDLSVLCGQVFGQDGTPDCFQGVWHLDTENRLRLTATGVPIDGTTRCVLVDFGIQFLVAKTEQIVAIGGWDERLNVMEHMDFFLNIQKHKLRVGYTHESTVIHDHINSPFYDTIRNDKVLAKGYEQTVLEKWGISGIEYLDVA